MTNDNWAIQARGVSKKFGLTLKQSMRHGLGDIAKKITFRSTHNGVLRPGEFWAVQDVDFELNYGEAIGIMGVNGCGKTTLLRILNGIYAPDTGHIKIKGRVGSLIAAGAGFAPTLSGRENVYVNGALLGLSTKDIDDLMDEIIAFSELGHFIDLPVKNYSSGMYVRLGFAIAALSKPDVLLMDEVLAVGDLNFQKKCYDYILQLKKSGTAIILVSHSPGAIWSICDRGLFMNKGRVTVNGRTEDAIRAYEDQNSRNAMISNLQFEQEGSAQSVTGVITGETTGTGDVTCSDIKVLADATDLETHELDFKQPFSVEISARVNKPIDNFILRVVIDAVHYRNIVTIDNWEQGNVINHISPGLYKFRIQIKNQCLRPGYYKLNIAVVSKHVGVHLFLWLQCGHFIIKSPKDCFLYSDPNAVIHFDAKYSYAVLTSSQKTP